MLTNWCGEFRRKRDVYPLVMPASPTYRTPEARLSAYVCIGGNTVATRNNSPKTPVLQARLNRQYQWAHALLQQAIEDGATLDTTGQPGARAYGIHTRCQPGLPLTARKRCIAEQIGYPVGAEAAFPDIPHIGWKSGVNSYSISQCRRRVQQAADAMIDRQRPGPRRASPHDCWCKAWPIALAPRS